MIAMRSFITIQVIRTRKQISPREQSRHFLTKYLVFKFSLKESNELCVGEKPILLAVKFELCRTSSKYVERSQTGGG